MEPEGNRGGEAAGETNPRGVGWDTPHLPPTGSIIVDLQRVLSHVEVMKGFFHRVGGRLVGRFMSPREDTKSKGVNTSGWRKITASQGETVVLRVQEEGAEQPEVIGVLYGGTRARDVERALPACETVRSGVCAHGHNSRRLVRRCALREAHLDAAGGDGRGREESRKDQHDGVCIHACRAGPAGRPRPGARRDRVWRAAPGWPDRPTGVGVGYVCEAGGGRPRTRRALRQGDAGGVQRDGGGGRAP